MPTYVKVAGKYKPWIKVWQKVGGVWVHTPEWHIKYRGAYKLIHRTRYPFYFNKTLSSTQNYNLREDLLASGWNGSDYVIATITIPAGVVISASTTGFYAFTSGFDFPQDSVLTLHVDGMILGRGGQGGKGAGRNDPSTPGASGGPALFLNLPTILTGAGLISGGGAGGGGGGAQRRTNFYGTSGTGRGGGGGGGSGLGTGGGVSSGAETGEMWGRFQNPTGGGTGGTVNGAGGGQREVLLDTGGGVILWQVWGGNGGAGGSASSGVTGIVGDGVGATVTGTWPPSEGGQFAGAAVAGYNLLDESGFSGTIRGYRT